MSHSDSSQALRHLLTLNGLDKAMLSALLDRAQSFVAAPGAPAAFPPLLAGRTAALLFFEPSTRTRASFELATRRLGAEVLNLNIGTSSARKGESPLDTFHTLQAMNVDLFIVRHAQAGTSALLARHAPPHVAIINAGEAHLNHPTQGLLDALTIRQHKPVQDGLAVAVIGDIHHSRVARSAAQALMTLGVEDFRWIGPPEFLPAQNAALPGQCFTVLEDGLQGADVVMLLRIQRERMQATEVPAADAYFRRYGLTEQRLALAAPDAIVMHPGPMNRGIEIEGAVADGPQSVIRAQVANGLAVRMAVMTACMETIHQPANATLI
jgi:aspartate carbamoyltransferase catalytic subunit